MVKQTWKSLSPGHRGVAAVLLAASLLHFAVGSYRAAAHGFVDLHIFLQRTQEFARGGVLYPVPDKTEAYEPSARAYKFPPLFAVVLLPQVRNGVPERIYFYHWIVHLVLYAAAILILLRALWPGRGPWFGILFLATALNFVPFFETLWRLQLETPILLLCVLALWFERKRLPYLAGIALGIATMLKIYPGFLLGWFIVRRCRRGLVGAALAIAVLGLLGWWVIGTEQNRVYFTMILPRLLQESARIDPENVSLAKPFESLFGLAPHVAKRVAQALSLVTLSIGYWFLQRQRRNAIAPDLAMALFVCCMLLFMPNAWTNYLLLLLVPFAVLLARLSDGTTGASWAWASAALCFFLTLFYTPCGPFLEGIPCTEDPPFLAVFRWPRWFHDLMVEWKVLAVILAVASWFAVALRSNGDRP